VGSTINRALPQLWSRVDLDGKQCVGGSTDKLMHGDDINNMTVVTAATMVLCHDRLDSIIVKTPSQSFGDDGINIMALQQWYFALNKTQFLVQK